jgi:hypothetical protein
MIFPVVKFCEFISLQSAGGLTADEFGMIALKLSMQQRSQHHTDLRYGNCRRLFFPRAGFPA